MIDERAIDIDSDGLRLEARFHGGGEALAALVVHPHPQYGGDMDNHVVLSLCETLAGLAASTLRLNLRGAGRSEGSYDNGRGEAADCRAAIESLRALRPQANVIAVGYSFGAMMVAHIAPMESLAGIALVSPPATAVLPASLPALIVVGSQDPVSPASSAAALASSTCRVEIVEGADHGWWPGVEELCDHVRAFAKRFA